MVLPQARVAPAHRRLQAARCLQRHRPQDWPSGRRAWLRTGGSHAQGVTRAARLLGTCPDRDAIERVSDKVERTRADGAESSSSARARRTGGQGDRARRRTRLTLIPPYDDPRIIAGQGTIGSRSCANWPARLQGPSPSLPVGGAAASGVVTAVRALRPDARVYGVEPALAAGGRIAGGQASSAGHPTRPTDHRRWPTHDALGALPFLHLVTPSKAS